MTSSDGSTDRTHLTHLWCKMEDMVVHMFLVSPLISWLTGSNRKWNRKSKNPGVMMGVIALVTIGILQLQREESNYYELLGVWPGTGRAELQAAYRRLAIKLHPDKNPDPDAAESFTKVKKAHETLTNDYLREKYSRFGDFSKTGDVDATYFWDLLFVAFFQTLIPVLFGLLYTLGTQSSKPRKIFLLYVLFVFCMEILLRFGPDDETALWWVPGLGFLLPFERVKVLHGFVPIILNGVLMMGGILHNDKDDWMETVGTQLLTTHLALVQNCDELVRTVQQSNPCSIAGGAEVKDGAEGWEQKAKKEIGKKREDKKDENGKVTRKTKKNDEEKKVPIEETENVNDKRGGHKDKMDEQEEENDEWLKEVEGARDFKGVTTQAEARSLDWLQTKGVNLQAFLVVRRESQQRAGNVTIGSVVVLVVLFFHFYFQS